MFHDQAYRPNAAELHKPLAPTQGTSGKKCRLLANCFKIVMSPQGAIYQYGYTVSPPCTSRPEERWVMEKCWGKLQDTLSAFVVRCPGHIFSPTSVAQEFQLGTPACAERSFPPHTVLVQMTRKYSAAEVNSGLTGSAQVVMQYIAKKLADSMMYQKVGRRYYNSDAIDRTSMTIFSGFFASLDALNHTGTHLQIDTMYRLMSKKTDAVGSAQNIIEAVNKALEGGETALSDPDVQAEWRKKCHFATVVTTYNNRFYRIKAVRFDMSPKEVVTFFIRDEKRQQTFSYAQYYEAYYHRKIQDMDQPMLEAFPEKDSEKVFLVPELCAITGFNDETRNNKNFMLDALKQAKVSPQERFDTIMAIAGCTHAPKDKAAEEPVAPINAIGLSAGCAKVMADWKFSLDREPQEVEGRVLDKLEVIFVSPKRHVIEEGNFQRWMRNGLQCPINLQDWILIYPETDTSVVDIWLRSLRDIAQVAFTMKMADPTRIICTNQKDELVKVLHERLHPRVQLVLLLTPHRDSKKVYQLFKQTTILKLPCITQVVKSETIRKRQSIAAVLSRIVLQINAKCGPLWHIDPKCDSVRKVFEQPTMVVGVDVYVTPQGDKFYGFAASTNSECSQYWSTGGSLQKGREWESKSEKLQDAFRNAMLHFASRNEGLTPAHVIVYRASAAPQDWAALKETEVEAIYRVLQATKAAGANGEPYEPKLTYVAVARHSGMRFFVPDQDRERDGQARVPFVKNPEPGTVVDGAHVTGQGTLGFYLMSQADGKGTITPTHYMVLHDTAHMSADVLQKLSYWLSFLYYNFTGSVKMPAPAQYAKTIAHLIGTAVLQEPHKRLHSSLFYL
mmetsp:Transcript_2324/g.6533  ORF Transcript_2324/g.6533 Transcript_2324/m.6533 type:complete len:843 (-) Transcript_2324:214-2742(-)